MPELTTAQLLSALSETNDADLLAAAQMAQEDMRKAVQRYGHIEAEVLRRFDGATTLMSAEWQCDRVAPKTYRWDDTKLATLRGQHPECVEVVVVPESRSYKVNTRKLLGLAKRLPKEQADQILAAYEAEEGRAKLSFTKRGQP